MLTPLPQAARTPEKAEAAIAELKAVTGKDDIHFLQLDLGSIKASKAAAEEFLACVASLGTQLPV